MKSNSSPVGRIKESRKCSLHPTLLTKRTLRTLRDPLIIHTKMKVSALSQGAAPEAPRHSARARRPGSTRQSACGSRCGGPSAGRSPGTRASAARAGRPWCAQPARGKDALNDQDQKPMQARQGQGKGAAPASGARRPSAATGRACFWAFGERAFRAPNPSENGVVGWEGGVGGLSNDAL